MIALDADTGKLKWHFQFTPHDTHDWDACEAPMLLDLNWRGTPRKLMVQANRNGFFYVLDRASGEFLMAKDFGRQNWAVQKDVGSLPIAKAKTDPTPEGNMSVPGLPAAQTGWLRRTIRKLVCFTSRIAKNAMYISPRHPFMWKGSHIGAVCFAA